MNLPFDPSRTALFHPEQRETLFEAGATYTPMQIAIEAARLAYLRAETASSERDRLTTALERAGFGAPVLLGDTTTDAQGFICRRAADRLPVLAFRGTQPDRLRDILTDAKALLVEWPETTGKVHLGFAAAARSVRTQVEESFAKLGATPDRLIIAGHSLGAALATLYASVLKPAWLVTLGSPRVGNAEFVASIRAGTTVRLVNCCDVVTYLPPPQGGYQHLEPSSYLTKDGAVIEHADPRVIRRDRQAARWEFLRRYFCRRGNVLLRGFADHAPINYARGFFSAAGSH